MVVVAVVVVSCMCYSFAIPDCGMFYGYLWFNESNDEKLGSMI